MPKILQALKLKFGDREKLWRDYANKVIPVVTAIGDIAINFAPAPSNVVWSAVKVLLTAHVSEREDLVAIMGCTDIVLCLVRRGRVYEEVYIGDSMPPRPLYEENLATKLVEVYTKCLEFLAFVHEEIKHGVSRRFFSTLVDPGYGRNRLSTVKALEQELELATSPFKINADDKHRRLLESLEEPIKRTDKNVMDILKVLDEQERDKAMEYADIEKFVNTEVDNFTVDWSPETKKEVKKKLMEKSAGMFRWTYLQWEQLKEFDTNTSVIARLGRLPKTLTKAYDEIYDKHEPESFERFMLQRAVRWVILLLYLATLKFGNVQVKRSLAKTKQRASPLDEGRRGGP
ncbi:hypothetical protein COL5a_008414 [Colletotrichum fioriniae]|nr:hypothetical protein COL5a_008414 [Colletotrichum fioriniae]